MVYENIVSNQQSEHSGRALLRERDYQDSFNQAYNHMESLRLNKSNIRANDESQQHQSNMFKFKNGSQQVHQSSDYLETMVSDKAMMGGQDPNHQSTQVPLTHRQQAVQSTFTLFNTE